MMFNIYLTFCNQNCTVIYKHDEVKRWLDMAQKQGFRYSALSLFPPLGASGRTEWAGQVYMENT